MVLWILPPACRLRLRGFHPLWLVFPVPFRWLSARLLQSLPRRARAPVWALPISLAATPGIDFSFQKCLSFFSSGYLDVSVRRVPSASLWIHFAVHEFFSCGFPHSDIRGSLDICSSPRLFAAYHVFLRLPVPRHPPCALIRLTCLPCIALHGCFLALWLFLGFIYSRMSSCFLS